MLSTRSINTSPNLPINNSILNKCDINDWTRVESIIVSFYDEKLSFKDNMILYHCNFQGSCSNNYNLSILKKLIGNNVKTSITVNYLS